MTLHYSQAGNGPNVVLLHGFCENNTCFNEQVLLLKEHCTVITPDLPGFGLSAAVTDVSMETMADAVYDLLQQLGMDQCFMIGHSMGGYVTLAFARKYAHLLQGFGLLHSTALPDDEARKQKRDQAIRVIDEKGPLFYARQFIPPLFMPDTAPETIAPCLAAADTFGAVGLQQALLAMKNRPDLTGLLRETTLPVFFGIGKHDSLIPADVMLQQAVSTNRAYVALLQHSAHMGHIEEAEALAAHIVRFVRG